MSDVQSAAADLSLRMWSTVGAAHSSVFRHVRFLPITAFQPLLIFAAIWWLLEAGGFAFLEITETMDNGVRERMLTDISFLVPAALALPVSLFAANWHRLLILGRANSPLRWLYVLSFRYWAYCGYAIVLMVVSLVFFGFVVAANFLVLLLLDFTPVFGPGWGFAQGWGFSLTRWINYSFLFLSLVVPLLWAIGFCRFSFVFPAIALDERYSLFDSHRHTKGLTLTLPFGLLLCLFPAVFSLLAPVAYFYAFDLEETQFLIDSKQLITKPGALLYLRLFEPLKVVAIFIAGYFLIVSISYISIAFQRCSGWVPEDPTTGSTRSETL